MNVTIKGITKENWRQAINLKVREDQQRFVAPNLFSIAQSKVEPYLVPVAIYDGETMVGFAMYGPDPADGSYWIVRLMVGEGLQGKGYGRAALHELVRLMSALPDCNEIKLSCVPDNVGAEGLYLDFGFEKTGIVEEGENVFRLPLNR
jgi:diamine N-acetyltransferase